MKLLLAALFTLVSLSAAFGQNEQSPIVEKEISYKNWTYKNIQTGADTDLRTLSKGKKLVIVVYFAPWCHNWQHDAPFLERWYERYKSDGLEIVGVGEYDPVESMRSNAAAMKVTFPIVSESTDRSDKQKTLHYSYRQSTGDTRNWGSPYYVLLEPGTFERKGDLITNKTHIVNGEIIESEGEKFIREKLGLPVAEPKEVKSLNAKSDIVQACETDKKISNLKKP